MTNTVQKYAEQQVKKLTEGKKIPDFQVGDTVRVNVRIVEGTNERIQAFEGVCIAKKNRGINSSFTVRKISHGEGVERVFQLYSPLVDSVKVVRRGDVRRAKLYYMRGLTGKAARIKEKMDLLGISKEEAEEVAVAADAPAPEPKPEEVAAGAKEEAKEEESKTEEKSEEPKAEEKKEEEKAEEAPKEEPKQEEKPAEEAKKAEEESSEETKKE